MKDENAPNFADYEGATAPHWKVKEKYSKRGFIESDHLIDDSYVQAVKEWKIGNIWGTISRPLESAIESLPEQERAAARKRRDLLAATPIFTKPDMQNYTRGKANTIALFKGVHDAVDQPQKDAVQEKIIGEFSEARLGGLVEYVKGTGNTEPTKLATALQSHIKPVFDKRFGDHHKIIKNKYDEQKIYVVGLNPANPEGAGREMDKILKRVRTSISSLRENTSNLFD